MIQIIPARFCLPEDLASPADICDVQAHPQQIPYYRASHRLGHIQDNGIALPDYIGLFGCDLPRQRAIQALNPVICREGFMNDILVIVPCGSATVWDQDPWAGPTAAYQAYRGTPFKLNRAYAERFADRWMMLSAKYGFIQPNFVIPEPYDVSFQKQSSNPVHLDTLKQQIEEYRLNTFKVAVGLGSKEYRWVVDIAFQDTGVLTVFPFRDLPLGTMMHVIKHAIEIGDSGIPRLEPREPLIG